MEDWGWYELISFCLQVLQALRRLKGGSNKRKEKMSAETQLLFDQLTEDANKLLDQGEYS